MRVETGGEEPGVVMGGVWGCISDSPTAWHLPSPCPGNWECGRVGRWKERYREGERPQAMAAVRERWTGHRKELAG